MKEVCRDVQIESTLLPTNAEELRQRTNNAPGARLDLSARGVWSVGEKTFLDIQVTHTHAESNRGKSLAQIYRENENEKKILNVQCGEEYFHLTCIYYYWWNGAGVSEVEQTCGRTHCY